MNDSDLVTFRELLASSMAKAVKSAKKLGYSGEAFSSMASIAWSTYTAGEQDVKKAEEKKA
jgi:hypothetical protein